MTVQRLSSPLSDARRDATAPRTPSRLSLAVSTAAVPAVILSSVALAQPATAAPSPVPHSAQTFARTAGVPFTTVRTAVVPAGLVASQVPQLRLPAAPTASQYIVRSGDTISAIASRHGLSTNAVLSLNGLSAASIIYPGQKIKLGAAKAPTSSPRTARPTAPTTARTYTVKSGDTLSAIAARHGVSLSTVLSANRLNLTSIIYPGQRLTVASAASAPRPAAPRAAAPKTAAPKASSPTTSTNVYTVKSGDTLGAIAARHGVSLSSVLSANGLTLSSIIHPGQKIKLSGSSLGFQGTPTKPTAPKAAPKPAPAAGQYTIKAGDTLGGIAARHNVSLAALMKANGMSSSTVIYVGRTLTIPAAGSTATPKPAATPAPKNLVPDSFLGFKYPDKVVADANANKQLLNSLPAPTQAQMRTIVSNTARSMGVDPSLALAFSYQESGFNQRAVSPANAIGAMQVIPMSGEWASELVGRKLNLLDPHDNATAGVAIIRALIRTSPSLDIAIASYYQGQYSVKKYGMYEDTKAYVAAIKAHRKNF